MVGLDLKIPSALDGEDAATDRQRKFIRELLQEVGGSGFPEATLRSLGKRQASAVIDQLLSFKAELAGDKPLNTSRITGIGHFEDSPFIASAKRILLAVVVIITLIVVSIVVT